SECKERLEDALLAIWQDKTGNDGYNALAVNAGLNWRDIAVLRTISRYLQQIGITYNQNYMWKALNNNVLITTDLAALFHARFDPATKGRDKAQNTIIHRIDAALEGVSSLDEDQIIRHFRNIIMGSLRTNFFKRDDEGNPIPEVSLKLAPREIEGLPEPRPYREIFMTSPRVEGLHLRYGKVARGGLRWSDRPEDFRTEVLGLVKAQQVKNAVIVPVGSKGGFVPKKLTPTMSRDEYIAEGTSAYKIFIANLLELTDNLDGPKVIHPDNVVRHEEDDPYLVVAADKGTATFSDTANGISQDYNFWLDDAFASGGSAGYDHKKMGITARGAWEAVKRHFREMDKDIQTEPFTAAGVGDMSGDVFGNGMLLSKATKLVAAFDH
ncbi:MAG: NAD-glutamate dehydrogenase domain-containing protein, partial [Roseibium sp.]